MGMQGTPEFKFRSGDLYGIAMYSSYQTKGDQENMEEKLQICLENFFKQFSRSVFENSSQLFSEQNFVCNSI